MIRSLFSWKKESCDSDSESDNYEEIDLGVPLVKRTIFTDTIFELYNCSVKNIIQKIDNWSFNRSLRNEHVQTIYNELKKMKFPHLLGTVKVVKDPSNNYRVIDGQHRLTAIKKILEEDISMEWDMEILVEVYNVTNTDDTIEVCDLYNKANTNLNIITDDLPDIHLIEIINALSTDKILLKKFRKTYCFNSRI
jgi:hypothetical protein